VRDDVERLRDIEEAIDRIERHTAGDRARFNDDELVQTWVIHHLEIIGEAARALSSEFRQRHRDVQWTRIVGMRNILVHRYFEIDRDVVWSVVQSDLPELKHAVQAMLRDDDDDDESPPNRPA